MLDRVLDIPGHARDAALVFARLVLALLVAGSARGQAPATGAGADVPPDVPAYVPLAGGPSAGLRSASLRSAGVPGADTLAHDALHRHVDMAREEPFAATRRAVLSHPLVLLGDVHPAAEPKRLLLHLLRDPAVGSRLDAVAFEIPASAQRWITAYLQSSPEDPGLLARDPGTLRALWGGREEWLAIFHELWRLNRTRGRPLEVVAMDLPGWPSTVRSERAAVSMYIDRDSAMAANLLSQLARCDQCERRGGPRVLAFVGGYHVLRGLEADLSIGRHNGRVIWLATRLERKGVHPFTILTDGLPRAVGIGRDTVLGATRVFDVLQRRDWPPAPYAVSVDDTFDDVAHAIREPDDPTDITFTLRPGEYTLRGAVDLFIFWGRTTELADDGAARRAGRD